VLNIKELVPIIGRELKGVEKYIFLLGFMENGLSLKFDSNKFVIRK
jgi:hypothetical protein